MKTAISLLFLIHVGVVSASEVQAFDCRSNSAAGGTSYHLSLEKGWLEEHALYSTCSGETNEDGQCSTGWIHHDDTLIAQRPLSTRTESFEQTDEYGEPKTITTQVLDISAGVTLRYLDSDGTGPFFADLIRSETNHFEVQQFFWYPR